MKLLPLSLAMLVASMPALADDGAITNKQMSRNVHLTVTPEDVQEHVSHSDHAFTDMMGFYVPAQEASGLVTEIPYCDIDNQPAPGEECTNPVETLVVAKPLVNVFIYGPTKDVADVPFGHSFMDTFAAVSLDDGETWKTTNLSNSANLSSFTLDEPTWVGGEMPDDEGDEGAPVIEEAEWEDKNANFGRLEVEGMTDGRDRVYINNAATGDRIFTVRSDKDGEFEMERNVAMDKAPCAVVAVADGLQSAAVLVEDAPENCEGNFGVEITEYPGGVSNVFHATAGNKTLVAWPSRFCQRGQPAYIEYDIETGELSERGLAIQDFIQDGDAELGVDALPDFTVEDDLYLVDLFGVAGAQKSQDFADEGYPQAGQVPFRCVWTARGVELPGDDPRTDELEASYMVWTNAERLTSGKRDPNRIEVMAQKGAGFVVTWQEDPEGLRPGQGLGPGEGWSGAVAHAQTDVWYSFINEQYFDIVENPDATTEPVDILYHDLTLTGRPQVFVPMAVPMRVTNNAKCNAPVEGILTDDAYCDFDIAEVYGIRDQCADVIAIPIGPQDEEQDRCVADSFGTEEADLVNRANTASTRPRLGLKSYVSDNDDGDESEEDVSEEDDVVDSAWVVFAAEESKGLGAYFFTPDGLLNAADGYADPCDEGSSDTCTEEIGKNIWYYSYDMGTPDTSAGIGDADSLVSNLVSQGNMLNMAEVYWETGELYGLMTTEDMWDYGEYNFDIVNTEIARRSSLLMQDIAKAEASANGLLAIPSWKQGTMRQGGPADVMIRRIMLDTSEEDVSEEETDGNPYAFANMACDEWLIAADTNPYYPGGVCADTPTNMSSATPDTCINDDPDGTDECPAIDCEAGGSYCIGDTNPILQGVVQGEGNTTRVLTWHQCPSEWSLVVSDGVTPIACETDENNMADLSWYNPLDVSKGHRGFIDGDFVHMLYAWSPNWRLNAKGSDRYDLYIRRSFDGGETWTVTPNGFLASDGLSYPADGTVTCESYRSSDTQVPQAVEPKACYDFAAGVPEHARNVTQHKSMRITTLDPRYAATKASIEEGCTDGLFVDSTVIDEIFTCDDLSEDLDSDLRNPSRYFNVYETGDNTTVTEGEAEPMDLFYARAEGFGDDYVVWTETDTEDADLEPCYPNTAYEVIGVAGTILENSGFCNEYDNMNTRGDTHSSEANLEANPDGSKMYGVWSQWIFDEMGEEVIESAAMARRIWWIDDWVSTDNAYTLPGTSQP